MNVIAASSLIFGSQPLAQAAANIRSAGFQAMDIGPTHLSPAAIGIEPQRAAEHLAASLGIHGIRPIAFNAGLRTDDMANTEKRLRLLALTATRLGVEVITFNPGASTGNRHAAVERLKSLADIAKTVGVALSAETHMGAWTERPEEAVNLCMEVPGLTLTLDPSHYFAGPADGRDWNVVLPWVTHVHLRDAGHGRAQIQMPPGEGWVDFPAVLRALRQAKYTGALSIEYLDTLGTRMGHDARACAISLKARVEELLAAQV